MKYIVFNPKAGSGNTPQKAVQAIQAKFAGECTVVDVLSISSLDDFVKGLDASAEVVVCGGDGTLNRFVNSYHRVGATQSVWYYPCGSGNDFMRDLQVTEEEYPICVDDYIRDLPVVTVKGKDYYFINGVGYGIDGYCCEVGDRLREKSAKKVDYTGIAIKGLLFHYRPTKAVVTVDGKTYEYKRVWIAPTMNGHYYGGGMMPAPQQDRLAKDKRLSTLIMHNCGNLIILCIFPSLFKGEHLRYKKQAALHTGYDITVKFDRPVSLQIDGETITDVSEYRAVLPQNAPKTPSESEMTV